MSERRSANVGKSNRDEGIGVEEANQFIGFSAFPKEAIGAVLGGSVR
jgi:hypothetical protein